MATTATPSVAGATSAALGDSGRAKAFHWITSGVTIFGLAVLLKAHPPREDAAEIAAWVLACLLADLMYVRIGRSITLSMSLPVVLAAALLHSPAVTALIALLGSLDPREIQGKSSVERILFNRSQVAISAATASLAMHAIAPGASDWPLVVAACAVGLIADSIVNVALVVTSTVLSGRAQWMEIIVGLWGSEPAASLGLYLSACIIAPLLALIYRDWGPWALLAGTAVLLPIRVALSRIQALGVSGEIIKIKDAEIASANESALDERRDERLTLAGDLHDEVLPALFKVHLMGEVLKQDLACGRLLDLDEDLPELLEATTSAQQAVRRVVGDLRSSRTAIRDVARAIRGHADQLESEGGPRIELSLCDVGCTDRARLVIVQVAREALVNSSRYSSARRIQLSLRRQSASLAELRISDDGRGFDPDDVDKGKHFGLQLMTERVSAVGGKLSVSSSPGSGTTITAQIPLQP
jgi:signal transduction histidine kinase